MTTAIATFIRDRSTGVGASGVTVEYRKHVDDSLIDSDDTDSDGLAIFSEVEAGYPGPWYLSADDGTNTYVFSSKAIGQIGPFRAVDLIHVFRMMGDGVIDNVGGELACSADGTNMNITVQEGLAFGHGIPYWWPVDQTVTLSASDATHPRIDRIVLRFYPAGVALEGKIVLDKLTGTPSASPAAPSLTQSEATYWEISLAQVRVDAGVTTIASNKVTDERTFSVGPLVDSSVTTAKIADGAVTAAKVASTAVSISDEKRGYVTFVDTQQSANTTSTSNTVSVGGTVQAHQTSITLPTGTWTVYATFDADFKNSADASIRISLEIDGTETTGYDFAKYADVYTRSKITYGRTGRTGTIFIRGRYCSSTTGVTSCRNPAIFITCERTA